VTEEAVVTGVEVTEEAVVTGVEVMEVVGERWREGGREGVSE
jgi:hypothetical protein